MRKFPTSIQRILGKGSDNPVQPLIEYARYLSRVTENLKNQLDPAISKHITIGNIHPSHATILVDSSTWMGKIRYLEPLILEILNRQGLKLKSLKFKVDPNHQPDEKRQPPATKISSKSSELLKTTAENTEDSALREALMRLAKHSQTD